MRGTAPNLRFDRVGGYFVSEKIISECWLGGNSSALYLKEPLKLDYLWAGLCLLGAVYFMFRDKL